MFVGGFFPLKICSIVLAQISFCWFLDVKRMSFSLSLRGRIFSYLLTYKTKREEAEFTQTTFWALASLLAPAQCWQQDREQPGAVQQWSSYVDIFLVKLQHLCSNFANTGCLGAKNLIWLYKFIIMR